MLPVLRPMLAAALFVWPALPPPFPVQAVSDRYSGTLLSNFVRAKDKLFYLERPAGTNGARLMVRDGSGVPRVLLDSDAFAKRSGPAARLAITNLLPSPDGDRIAVGLVPDGAAYATHTRIVETADGTVLPDDLPRTSFGASAWSLDGTTLFYNQLPPAAAGRAAERDVDATTFAHRIGSSGADRAVFGAGLDPNVPLVPTDVPNIEFPVGSNWALGIIAHGGHDEITVYVAPIAAVLSGGQIPWRKVIDVDDRVTSLDVRGDSAFLLTDKDASRRKVTVLDLADTNAAAADAPVIVPPSETMIRQVAVAGDALYVRGTRGDLAELRKLPWGADGNPGAIEAVTLPFAGTLQEFAVDARADGAVAGLMSATKPLLVYALDANGAFTDVPTTVPAGARR